MPSARPTPHLMRALAAVAMLCLLAGCQGGKEQTKSETKGEEDPSQTLEASSTTWTPEALEELLAPVALYPDPVLLQVLTSATNPQEVLDAGNWMIANPNLEGKALDQAAEKAGFTETMRGVMQFPQVVDQMCLGMDWTEELGQAYVNDQAGVMDAVQRLRAQAESAGTLKTSKQMKVETVSEGGQKAIAITPPSREVVYVPTYDPVAAYAPGTTTTTTTTTGAATTTTTTTPPGTTASSDDDDDGGSALAVGLLAFGAGVAIASIANNDYYYGAPYGSMWYHPMPYHPPYPYRPVYGGGFYPANAYNRPNNYVRHNTVIVNQNNNYYNRYDHNSVDRNRNNPQSPISKARPNRPELSNLNAEAKKGPKRAGPSSSDALKGRGGQAAANTKARPGSAQSNVGGKGGKAAPKVQGTYAGAKPGANVPGRSGTGTASRPAAGTAGTAGTAGRAATASRPGGGHAGTAKVPNVDRGHDAHAAQRTTPRPSATSQAASRPSASTASASRPTASTASRPSATSAASASRPSASAASASRPAPTRTAVSGASSGASERAASARGHQSASGGASGAARSGGGGGGHRGR